jgi:hypothetical protein
LDSLTSAAARSLAAGDPLGALKRVALRDDPPALALRGIAMAQMGDFARSRELLRRAARAFGPREAAARARCVVAEAEVALAMREVGGSWRALEQAGDVLQAQGDARNALQARLVATRRYLLLGRLQQASQALEGARTPGAPPALQAVAQLAAADLALRELRVAQAERALAEAYEAARRARIPALLAECVAASAVLARPAARLRAAEGERLLRLDEVAALLASGAIVVDGCRHGLHCGSRWIALARRPVLFTLARELALAGEAGADRDRLIAAAFRTRRPDETHRARLRVEIGRLRALVRDVAGLVSTPAGFVLQPHGGRAVALVDPPIDGELPALLALLADGAAWSTSSLALALGLSQRTVQRALADLQAQDRVRAVGNARARRWVAAPLAEFATNLLLPLAVAAG